MRKLTTAITAAALAFSMMAAAVPAAAVTGYDSAYAGESAFVNITAGQTQNFQVFFANVGTTSWQKGTSTQVDLAACLEDKVTCNAQDASEATWNSGWLSAVRYATTTQSITPPGSLGTFSYNITAPVGVAAGIYHFNGDLVLASTGERIHPEGYFQDANTGASAGAPTLTSLSPTSGPSGTTVTINGTGFVCTPAFPTASFGGTNAVVTSCGSTAIVTKSPDHALGAVTVTVSNSGSGPSNGLTYTYTDTTGPTFVSFTVSGDVMTVTFSEPVCGTSATTDVDWTVRNVSAGGAVDYASGGSTANIPATCTDAVATYTIILGGGPIPNGSFVEATLNEAAGGVATPGSGSNSDITDASSNAAIAPQSRQTTVTAPETTKPTLTSASGAVGSGTITLNFSEPVYCASANGVEPGALTASDFSVSDSTVTAGSISGCGTSRATADNSFKITVTPALKADTTYTVTIKGSTTAETVAGGNATGEIKDTVNNALTVPASVTFTSGAGDFTPPTIVDARMTSNVGNSNFNDATDAFSLTFSETMTAGDNDGSTINLQDQDGTLRTLTCNGAAVGCVWNTAKTTVTVTLLTPIFVTDPPAGDSGTTPGMQIPFNVTGLTGAAFTDGQGNATNVLGSADRLVDFE